MSQGMSAPGPRRWWALALLGTAFFMLILDGTIVYVALPQIATDLGFSAGGAQWVMSAYLLCFGGLLLLGGRTADLLGRRRVFMAGVGLFVSSSLLCGLAWSPAVLIAARAVQGISAAIMAPTALSLVMMVFPEGAERNKALGIWGGIGGIGATAGLLIGGPVTDSLGWQWVFFINVPVGLAVLADSSFNIGSALGIAILSTVAVSHAHDELRGAGREAGLRAMTEGFRVAFAVAAGIAALGVLLALLLFRPRRLAEGNTPGRGQGPIPSRRRNGGRRSGRWPGAPARSRSCSCGLSDDLDRCHDALSRLAAHEKLGDRAWLTRTWRPRV